MHISFGLNTAFAKQRNILVDGNYAMAKAAPGAVGLQPPDKGLAPVNQTLFAPNVGTHFRNENK